MNDIQRELMMQIISYCAVVLLVIMSFMVFLRGFLWNYIKVRTSFGRLVLIKQRTTIRDKFYNGWIEGGFLNFKDKKDNQTFINKIPVDISQKNPFYRCLNVLWIDINEEKNAVCNVDYSAVTGYDSKKYSDLMTRCLQQPIMMSNTEKIMIGLAVLAAILALAAAYLGFSNYGMLTNIQKALPEVCKGVVNAVATGGP